MKNYITFTLALITSILLFTQCKKEPCEDISCLNGAICNEGVCECPTGYDGAFCENKTYLLKEISGLTDDEIYNRYFQYNDMNRIIESTTYDEGILFFEYQYVYVEDSIFIQSNYIDQDETWTHILTRPTPDQLERIYVFASGNTSSTYYSGLDSTCGYTQIDSAGSEDYYTRIEYTSDCNITYKHYRHQVDTLVYTIEILVDDSNYIFQSDDNAVIQLEYERSNFYMINKKNILSLLFYNSEGVIVPNNSYEATFVLNDDNYPIKETRTTLDGFSIELTYEYY